MQVFLIIFLKSELVSLVLVYHYFFMAFVRQSTNPRSLIYSGGFVYLI